VVSSPGSPTETGAPNGSKNRRFSWFNLRNTKISSACEPLSNFGLFLLFLDYPFPGSYLQLLIDFFAFHFFTEQYALFAHGSQLACRQHMAYVSILLKWLIIK
jgi:hypothetical protein